MKNYTEYTIEQINNALNDLSSMKESFILMGTDVEEQRELLMNAKRQKILDTYPIRIWQTADGTWKAHVPDSTKDRNRKLLQGKAKDILENRILENYEKYCDERLLFRNYFAVWLINHKAKLVKGGTIYRNYLDYNKFIKDTPLDSMRITNIETKHIKDLLNDVIDEYHLTQTAFSNLRSIFNGLFQHAFDVGDIPSDPTYRMKIENTNILPDPLKFSDTEVFDDEESALLTEYIFFNYTEIQPLISLALLLNFQLGLRVGELCTLKKSDISFKSKEIAIQRTERSYKPLKLVDGKIVEEKTIHFVAEGEVKKNSNRLISLSDEALAIIKESLRYQEEHGIKSEYLFPHENGEHILRERYNEILEHYCKKVSIPVKSIHKTRKTVITKLFEAGMGIDDVMKISGHRDKKTVIDHYIYTAKKIEERKMLNTALATGRSFSA